MSNHTLVLNLPDSLYQQLEANAQATKRPLSEVALRNLAQSLPPLEDDLPPALKEELAALASLSDSVLWQIAKSVMNTDEVALYDLLLERLKKGTLTVQGQTYLATLRQQSDELMLRKAHAFALLKSRGHKLPTLDELRQQQS